MAEAGISYFSIFLGKPFTTSVLNAVGYVLKAILYLVRVQDVYQAAVTFTNLLGILVSYCDREIRRVRIDASPPQWLLAPNTSAAFIVLRLNTLD
jgi:hypothetical protein